MEQRERDLKEKPPHANPATLLWCRTPIPPPSFNVACCLLLQIWLRMTLLPPNTCTLAPSMTLTRPLPAPPHAVYTQPRCRRAACTILCVFFLFFVLLLCFYVLFCFDCALCSCCLRVLIGCVHMFFLVDVWFKLKPWWRKNKMDIRFFFPPLIDYDGF